MNLNSQNQFYLLFFTLLGHIASVNNVVVTVLRLLQALHRRIIVYRILSEILKFMTHTSEYHCHGTSNLTTWHQRSYSYAKISHCRTLQRDRFAERHLAMGVEVGD